MGTLASLLSVTLAITNAAACAWQAFYPYNPSDQYNVIQSIVAFSPNDAWAAGWTSDGNQILHFDGSQWLQARSPSKEFSVEAVTGFSDNDLWAVGYLQAKASPAALHWDGRAWTAAHLGSVGLSNGLLMAVSRVRTQIWAAGYYRAFGHIEAPLIVHFDGKEWLQDEVYTPPNVADLLSVAGTSPSDVWAGGAGDPTTGGLIERRVPSKNVWVRRPNLSFGITAISPRSKNDVWAIGGPSGGDFIERWDGQNWSQVEHTRPGAYLWGLDSTPANGYTWVAGFYDNNQNRTPFIDRFRGGQWHDTSVLEVGTDGTALTALAPIAGSSDEWAAGFYTGPGQTQAFDLIERWTCPLGAE